MLGRRHTLIGLVTLCLVAFALNGAVAADAKPTLDKVIDGLHTRYDKVTDFKATFKQVLERKHLPKPLKKSGNVYFKRPGMMRWDYLVPEKVYYISDGTTLWSYEKEQKVAYKLNVKDSELYSSLKFLFGQGDLRKEFNVSLEKKPAEGGLARLKLEPKKTTSNYKRLYLHVDPTTFEIKRTELVDPVDNVSTISFGDVDYSPRDPKGFSFTPPKGVKVDDRTAGGILPKKPGGGK